MTKPSLWGKPTTFADAMRIPIHIGDVLRTKHFIHYRRRRQSYMYHVVIGLSDDPQVTPLAQVITGHNGGGNISLEALLRNWLHVEIVYDSHSLTDLLFYDRKKVPK